MIEQIHITTSAIKWLLAVPGVIAISTNFGEVQIQIQKQHMTDFAPLEQWLLNQHRQSPTYPYEHTFKLDDCKIYAISENPL